MRGYDAWLDRQLREIEEEDAAYEDAVCEIIDAAERRGEILEVEDVTDDMVSRYFQDKAEADAEARSEYESFRREWADLQGYDR